MLRLDFRRFHPPAIPKTVLEPAPGFRPRTFLKTNKLNIMSIFDQMNSELSAFDKACNDFKESCKKMEQNIQSIRQSIRDNHMVFLPEITQDEREEAWQIEEVINDILYLVYYKGEINSVDDDTADYKIKILEICQSPVADVDGEYEPLTKIEKETYDTLHLLCDVSYIKTGNIGDDIREFQECQSCSGCAHDQVAHE